MMSLPRPCGTHIYHSSAGPRLYEMSNLWSAGQEVRCADSALEDGNENLGAGCGKFSSGLHAPFNRELCADFFRRIAEAPGGDEDYRNRVPGDGETNTIHNLLHMALRHEKLTAVILREVYDGRKRGIVFATR